MKTIIELISNEVMTAFKEAGYDENMGKVTLSNRPDLCEYQCNGAMAGAKAYHKAPIMIAEDVVAHLQGSDCLAKAVKNKGLERSFKQAIPKEVYEALEKEMEVLESE